MTKTRVGLWPGLVFLYVLGRRSSKSGAFPGFVQQKVAEAETKAQNQGSDSYWLLLHTFYFLPLRSYLKINLRDSGEVRIKR